MYFNAGGTTTTLPIRFFNSTLVVTFLRKRAVSTPPLLKQSPTPPPSHLGLFIFHCRLLSLFKYNIGPIVQQPNGKTLAIPDSQCTSAKVSTGWPQKSTPNPKSKTRSCCLHLLPYVGNYCVFPSQVCCVGSYCLADLLGYVTIR